MTDSSFPFGSSTGSSDWAGYLEAMKHHVEQRSRRRRWMLVGLIGFMVALFCYLGWNDGTGKFPPPGADAAQSVRKKQPAPSKTTAFGRNDIRAMLQNRPVYTSTETDFRIAYQNQTYQIDTSLDSRLQQRALNHLMTKTSRHIGIVVMDPFSGRILAMIGFDKLRPGINPCTQSDYPAASVFKIVTAAAALDRIDLEPSSTIPFSGNKHTLYPSQITNRAAAQRISLRDAFAQSVNPVFGKIGAIHLGKNTLDQYAYAFGFNRWIDFDLPLETSPCRISAESFHLAEIASGYNRTTRLSPVHGAMIASAVLNGGRIPAPSLVDQVRDSFGNRVYVHQISTVGQALSPESASILRTMMGATIDSGTGRRSFAGYQNDPILARLEMGGKTGTMDNDAHDVHYDWFVGFGADRHTGKAIAVSVMVGHEHQRGTRAGQYARLMIREFFGYGQPQRVKAPVKALKKPVLTKKAKIRTPHG
ncbi:MAG: penicillin-binding transpeptidase domain-containing protein [Thermodesulfobacteriota bacterium]